MSELRTDYIEDEEMNAPIGEAYLFPALEAYLFSAGDPISLGRLSELCGLPAEAVKNSLAQLAEMMEKDARRGVCLRVLEDSYVLTPKPEMKSYLERMFAPKQRAPLSAAAYETLAVVAYNQPVTRAQVEAVRGVSSDSIVSRLLERGWIRECGNLDAPGHPALFETTRQFLLEFGISSVKELPALELMMYGTIRDLESSLNDASNNVIDSPVSSEEKAGIPDTLTVGEIIQDQLVIEEKDGDNDDPFVG